VGVILLIKGIAAGRIIQMLNIGNNITISEDQLNFVFSRSSGPGGQNVNKVNTRVTLLFDVKNCIELTAWQKGLILRKLKTRINKDGVLRVIAQQHRTQAVNRKLTIERLQELLTEALKRMPPRKKTKMPYSVKRKRLNDKKHRGKTKQLRGKVEDE
jgi:ribosome-associated protein